MILEASHIEKKYHQGQIIIPAVNDVSFSVEEGSTVSIIGRSGSGKTTLLSLLGGLDEADAGEIKINGKNICKFSEKEMTNFRAQNIGIVFQQFHLIQHLTALENVSVPLEILGKKNVEKNAIEALAQVGLEDRAHHLPDQLSGGEKQRVAIARAFISRPKLLLADEPSGNLDQKTGQIVMKLLFDLVEEMKMTLILVTHDEQLAQSCRVKLQMANGFLN
ncbi:MAG: ABC transporter ATP-binding protein [Bdellovibrionales bacterium]|nr:ABC transporter ATP-binding protein [Bdellovibrionales bacterium]